MLHTFRANERFRAHIEAALQQIKRELDAGHLATLDTSSLRPVESNEQRSGSKPLITLRDASGKSFVFKQCEPALAAAEEAAYLLQRLGGRPAVPARAMSLEIEGMGPVQGLLKPFLEFEVKEELASDTTTWTTEQRAVMLLEHAWEWFLDNLDTNTSQYALLGSLRVPINIDWDRAFFSEGRSELTRFAKYRATLPNARTFLYVDYAAGKTKLPLWLLASEARRIRRLPKAELRRILTSYARVRFDDPALAEQFVARMLIRQRGIEREVATFMRSLWDERRSFETPAESLREFFHHQLLLLWGHWQIVLNAVLRGPIGRGARQLLSAFRGRRMQKAQSSPAEQLPSGDALPESAR
jgi:hypothetical protein